MVKHTNQNDIQVSETYE